MNEINVHINPSWPDFPCRSNDHCLGTAELWDEEPTTEIETIDLANTMLDDWALPLLVLGVLMAMAMIGAAYLVRDERRENLEWEQRGEDA